VKEYKKLNNNTWVLLLFRYRSDEYTSSDYFSILVLKRKSENMEWFVNFKLFQPEMSELFQEDFWVIELGPMKESENVILKVGRVGSEKNPEKTGMFWEAWNLDSEKRLETLRRTRPFAKFDAE
jgi:hypothetical protein